MTKSPYTQQIATGLLLVAAGNACLASQLPTDVPQPFRPADWAAASDERLAGRREEAAGEAAEHDHAVDDRQLGPAGGQEFRDEQEQPKPEHRGQGTDGDTSAVVRVSHVTGEEDRADERDDLSQADRTERQGGVGAFVLGQAKHLPGDRDVLDLDGQRAENDRRQV